MNHGSGEIEPRYCNHLSIGQNAFEFLLDFGEFREGDEGEPRIHTRIVTSPFYAKCFSELLQDSLRRHEERYGPIPEATPEPPESGDAGD